MNFITINLLIFTLSLNLFSQPITPNATGSLDNFDFEINSSIENNYFVNENYLNFYELFFEIKQIEKHYYLDHNVMIIKEYYIYSFSKGFLNKFKECLIKFSSEYKPIFSFAKSDAVTISVSSTFPYFSDLENSKYKNTFKCLAEYIDQEISKFDNSFRHDFLTSLITAKYVIYIREK